MQAELLSAFGTLIFIVILLAVVLFFVKRYAARKQSAVGSGPEMRILNRVNLQARKQIYMLQVGARVLIVGVSENNINILSEINDPEEIRRLTGQAEAATILPNPQQKLRSHSAGGHSQNAASQQATPTQKMRSADTPKRAKISRNPDAASAQPASDFAAQLSNTPAAYSQSETPSELSFSDFLKSMRIKVTPPSKNS